MTLLFCYFFQSTLTDFALQWLLSQGAGTVEGSTHGRPVCAVHTLQVGVC